LRVSGRHEKMWCRYPFAAFIEYQRGIARSNSFNNANKLILNSAL
jgi:hypothetical protein